MRAAAINGCYFAVVINERTTTIFKLTTERPLVPDQLLLHIKSGL